MDGHTTYCIGYFIQFRQTAMFDVCSRAVYAKQECNEYKCMRSAIEKGSGDVAPAHRQLTNAYLVLVIGEISGMRNENQSSR